MITTEDCCEPFDWFHPELVVLPSDVCEVKPGLNKKVAV